MHAQKDKYDKIVKGPSLLSPKPFQDFSARNIFTKLPLGLEADHFPKTGGMESNAKE